MIGSGRFLTELGMADSHTAYDAIIETVLDDLAAHIEAQLDVDGLLKLAR